MDTYPFCTIPRPYSDEFKREVLRHLALGQRPSKVSKLFSVSLFTLNRWRQEHRASEQPIEPNASVSVSRLTKRPVYSAAQRVQILDLLRGQSLSEVAATTGVSPSTLSRWQSIADGTGRGVSQIVESSQPVAPPSDVVMLSNEPICWPSPPTPTPPALPAVVTDRSKYDAEFRSRAIQKLSQGQRFSRVSRSMGVPVFTLHRWKNEIDSAQEEVTTSFTNHISALNQQLQQLEQERKEVKELLASLVNSPAGFLVHAATGEGTGGAIE